MNNFMRATRQAIFGLTRNPGRTALTTLGIVIGIATVIIVLSAGAGFNSLINEQVEAFGTNFVTIETRVPPSTRDREGSFNPIGDSGGNRAVAITSLKNRDVSDIKKISNVRDAYGAVIGQKVVAYKNVTKNSFVFGSDPSRFDIDTGVLAEGRPYTESENDGASQVAILGADIAKDLFGDDSPIDKTIRVGQYNFVVIGVYKPKGGLGGLSTDDKQVFIPLETAQKKILGIDYLLYVLAQLKNNEIAEVSADDIREVLRHNHTISDPAKDDFVVNTQANALDIFGTILSAVTLLLIAVATISLVVGGVGIMNIMYVVVTERISEIGLKKSLGARNADILLEFLIESVLLTLAGGVLGIALGAVVSFLISIVAKSFGLTWAFSVPLTGILLGLGVSGTIGLIFGVFPARRASQLDPIDALRYE